MAKRPKPKPKPRKRGPKEERLVIDDPEGALDKLLKPAKRLGTAMRRLRDNSKL